MITLNDCDLSKNELEEKFIELLKYQLGYTFKKFLTDQKAKVREADKAKLDVFYVPPNSTDAETLNTAMTTQLSQVFSDISLRDQCFPGNSAEPSTWTPEIALSYLKSFQLAILKFEEGLSLPEIFFKLSRLETKMSQVFAGEDKNSKFLNEFAFQCIYHAKNNINVEPQILEFIIGVYQYAASEHRNVINEFCSQALSLKDLYQRINSNSRFCEVLLSIKEKTASPLLNQFIDLLQLRDMYEQYPKKHLNCFFYQNDTTLNQQDINQNYKDLNSDLKFRIDLVCYYLNQQPQQLQLLLQDKFNEFRNMLFGLKRAAFPQSQSYQELCQWLEQN